MCLWAIAVIYLSNIGCSIFVIALSTPGRKVIRVCQSPGCQADGALATFKCMSTLAPPGIDVLKGGCVSLCGQGPVVEISNNFDDVTTIQTLKKKRVKGSETIISLLDEIVDGDGDEPALKPYMRDRLILGYELSLEAEEAYKAKSYALAVELYTDAIESGRKTALILQETRAAAGSDTEQSMQWLVTSFKNSCRARIVLKDLDNARRDAFAATVFSQNLDPDAHECLAEVCSSSDDALGELQAMKAAILQYKSLEEELSKPLPGSDAPRRAIAMKKKSHATARIRELGFRVTKRERELKSKNNALHY